MSDLIVDKKYKIQKFEGKGGWSFVEIDADLSAYKSDSGWFKVKGYIDDYELINVKIAPMGKGRYMLAIKLEIRKAIKKEAGDVVHLKLALDSSRFIVPTDILECLEMYPKAEAYFKRLTESNQRYYVDWITQAKNIDTQVEVINKMIDRLLEGKKFYDL